MCSVGMFVGMYKCGEGGGCVRRSARVCDICICGSDEWAFAFHVCAKSFLTWIGNVCVCVCLV